MPKKDPAILVVEDDSQIRRFLKVGLEGNGYLYFEAGSGKQGLVEATTRIPDLIILDLGLPDMDGLEFIDQVRSWSRVPILVLTAREKEQDKVTALDKGADDYLTKPFGIEELLARIRVALRHVLQGSGGGDQGAIFENGPLKIDFAARQIFLNGREVHLTRIEYKILALLAKHAGKVLTQSHLLKEIWGPTALDQGNYLRVHMHQLRHKIEKNPTRPLLLINEPGVGYRMKLIEAG